MTATLDVRGICQQADCGPGNVHFAQPVVLRELEMDPHCVERWRTVALLGFIARATQDGIFLDADSLRVARGWAKGPESWPIGIEVEYVPYEEAEATHRVLHWRMDLVHR